MYIRESKKDSVKLSLELCHRSLKDSNQDSSHCFQGMQKYPFQLYMWIIMGGLRTMEGNLLTQKQVTVISSCVTTGCNNRWLWDLPATSLTH